MTPRPASAIRTAKVTTQLSRGDLITIDGLGAFAVIRPEPYGSQALIKLAWENLAVIAPRDITWTTVSPATALLVHGYQPCPACDGKGITFGDHDQRDLTWDHQAAAGAPRDALNATPHHHAGTRDRTPARPPCPPRPRKETSHAHPDPGTR